MRGSTLRVLLAAALLAGCGGGSGADSSEGVSKKEFVARADAICAKASRDRQALQDPSLFARPYDQDKIAEYSESLGAMYRTALGKLEALEAPKGDEARIGTMYARFAEAAALSDDLTASARAEDVTEGESVYFGWIEIAAKGQAIAAKYGLQACASFGMP